MIICTEVELSIGEYRRGTVTDVNCRERDVVPFVVLERVTEDEYRKAAAAAGATHNPPFLGPMNFYRVSTD